MNEPSKDVGSILKKERESKGVSLEMVHEATKIPIDSLKAIEEGYKVRTLTSFYYKSFVRIYAQYLGLNPESLVAQIATDLPKKKVDPLHSRPAVKKARDMSSLRLPARPRDYRKVQKALKLVGMSAVAALVVWLLFGFIRKIRSAAPAPVAPPVKVEKKPLKKEKVQLPAAVPEPVRKVEEKKKPEMAKPLEIFKPAETARPAEPVRPPMEEKKVEVVKKPEPMKPPEARPPEAKPVASETKPVENKEAKAEPAKNAPAPHKTVKVSVAVRAINNAWLNVRADGSSVFQGILKKGTSDSWTAVKVIDISGKDINQLEFEVNGKAIGRLSRRGAPARKIRITPAGLTVEK